MELMEFGMSNGNKFSLLAGKIVAITCTTLAKKTKATIYMAGDSDGYPVQESYETVVRRVEDYYANL